MQDTHIISKFYGSCNRAKAGPEHFKEHHCTQDGNRCQPIYLLFIVRQVVLPAVFLIMCCLGIQELHFLDLILFSVSLRYFCTASVPTADLVTPCSRSAALDLPAPVHLHQTKGALRDLKHCKQHPEQLLLKSEKLFQQTVHKQHRSASSKHHQFPFLPC